MAFSSAVNWFRSRRRTQQFQRLLRLELLEDRWVPTTITPTTFADGVLGSGSLREAVLQFNADPGTEDDTIQLLAGTYTLTIRNTGGHHETAGLEGDLNVTSTAHRLIVQGAGASTVIDASGLQDRVFQIVNPGTAVVFRDLVIRGGLAQDDGSNGTVAGSTDALGGGILANSDDVTLENVVLQNNVARGGDGANGPSGGDGRNARGGGLYASGGSVTTSDSTLSGNQALGGQGGNGTVSTGGNGGAAAGGGIYSTSGLLSLTNTMISGQIARGGSGGAGASTSSGITRVGSSGNGQGGGLFASGGMLTLANATISSNSGSTAGGGLFNSAGTVTVSTSTLSANSASQGAGLYNQGTVTMSSSHLLSNRGYAGGGIDNASGTLMVGNTILSSNSAYLGGGIFNSDTVTVSNSTLSSNAASYGGGIYNSGRATVSNSAITANSASYGGGIANLYAGLVTVTNSSLSANSSSGGGGIYNDLGNVVVSSSTLSANSAGTSFSSNGGGIYNQGGGVVVSNSTLSSNSAYSGGGILNSGPTLRLQNTILAGNRSTSGSSPDIQGSVSPFSSYNLVGDGTGLSGISNGVNHNQIGTSASPLDPLLSPLADHGGPTQTYALLPGSPALDAGDPSQSGSPDQRGVIRSGAVNIGAFQASAASFVVTAPASVTAGDVFDVFVSVLDLFGQPAVGYTGTISFSSAEPHGASLPPDYTFTLADAGSHTFVGLTSLYTAGTWDVTVTDAVNNVSGSANVNINAGAAVAFQVMAPASAVSGTPFDVTILAVDAFGNVDTHYAGTIHFSSSDSDPGVVLPSDYTFGAGDSGMHTFPAGVTLITSGDQTLTVTDLSSGITGGTVVTL
jgi:hypothetical protein